MHVKNLKESVFFPVGLIFKDDAKTIVRLEGEDDDTFLKRSRAVRLQMEEFAKAKREAKDGPVQLPYQLSELQACLSPERLAEYQEAGCELPNDLVKCSLSVGSLIFDLYTLTAKRQAAPLAAAHQQREVAKLAKFTKREVFEIAPHILEQMRPGLETTEIWEKLGVSLELETPNGPRFVRVTHHAANHFRKALDGLIELFLPVEKAEEA